MSGTSDLDAMREFMAFLHSLPELLPEAPRWAKFQVAVAAKQRLLGEGHLCLRCGAEADAAILSQHKTSDDLRWLDLCVDCVGLLQQLGRREAGRDEP